MSQPPKTNSKDWAGASRTQGRSIAGTFTFITLRLLDLPLQYYLLQSLGTCAQTALLSYKTLVLFLAFGSAAKQIYWVLFLNHQEFPPLIAVIVAIFNTLSNSSNTFLALWSRTTQQPLDNKDRPLSSVPLLTGLSLYMIGLLTEWYSEVQRTHFKAQPENKGKPYSGGLFSLARNINYGGYTLWRTGYALVCGGWIWGVVVAGWFAFDFGARAIPGMDAYCAERYGKQWDEVRRKVPYKLLPWVY